MVLSIGIFDTVEKALAVGDEYIADRFYCKSKTFVSEGNGVLRAIDSCSYPTVLTIVELEVR